MKIEFVPAGMPAPLDGIIVAPLFEGAGLCGEAARLDASSGGALARAMAVTGFVGAKSKHLDIVVPAGLSAARVMLIGVGSKDSFDAAAVESFAAEAYQALKTCAKVLQILLDVTAPAVAVHAALGARLAAYRFDRYRTREKAENKPSIELVQIVTSDVDEAITAGTCQMALADAITFARDLVSEPANILYPENFARRVKAMESLGLTVEILGEEEMTELGMGSLLSVGQGSARTSHLAIVQWKGAADCEAPPIAFVGKGVCFDAGGISIKPADGMENMKSDMAGAAAVAGLMQMLAVRNAKVNAVGILGLVENMPDAAALRPGDIVTSMSGQTIEIIDTDAEGRLVLADALWYCQHRFKPQFMIDLATLTGAVITALGNEYAGLFSNDDVLAEQLLASSEVSGEKLWRLPLAAAYEKEIDSPVADVKNSAGHQGSAIKGALFIQRFVNGVPWAHLDIASTAWRKPGTPPTPTKPESATGFGVRLLNQFVADHYA